MKMYEYLACAKPIVAAPGAGIDMFKDNVYVADNMALFSGLINKALSEDSEVKRQSRLKAVETHSWQNRVEQMTDIVFEKLKVK
jgi:glycosyltransferase involved in cell wall biosynthesis